MLTRLPQIVDSAIYVPNPMNSTDAYRWQLVYWRGLAGIHCVSPVLPHTSDRFVGLEVFSHHSHSGCFRRESDIAIGSLEMGHGDL